MITIENLSKSFGKQELFNDISFKINKKSELGW
jgi:ABC-type polar amino acid transport system, ATPase component